MHQAKEVVDVSKTVSEPEAERSPDALSILAAKSAAGRFSSVESVLSGKPIRRSSRPMRPVNADEEDEATEEKARLDLGTKMFREYCDENPY